MPQIPIPRVGTLANLLDEARELVPEAAAVAVSAKTGAGLDELRSLLGQCGITVNVAVMPALPSNAMW